jgi:hypothetical protein
VCCDGPPDSVDERERYLEYKSRLREFARTQEIQVVELATHEGLPGVIREGFNHVHTPLSLVFQHDAEVTMTIDVAELCATLLQDELQVNHVRLNHKRNRPRKCDTILKEFNHPALRVPLLRTNCWSDMPHFTTTRYYRERVLPLLKPTGSSRGVENQLGPLLRADIEKLGFDVAHPRHGTFIYGKLWDPPIVRHLDGRRTKTVEELQNKRA